MSKNIFSALQEASDSDKEKSPDPQKRPTKKQQRDEDKVKREVYGDKVIKDDHQKPPKFDGPKDKGDYASGERRPYERHSGTGRQAFGNNYKKGGHGKGNVGKPEEDETAPGKKGENEEELKKQEAEKKEPEPKEEIITLDQYVASSGVRFDFLNQTEQKPTQNFVNKDATVKPIQPKQKEEQSYSKKSKQIEIFAKTSATNGVVFDQPDKGESKRKNSKRLIKTELSDKDFPSLT